MSFQTFESKLSKLEINYITRLLLTRYNVLNIQACLLKDLPVSAKQEIITKIATEISLQI